jgi:hypothetical protein|tara:strand:- start:2344 stop:2460 length:117 start_codon:yes stop_codon:yes gene_type:complete
MAKAGRKKDMVKQKVYEDKFRRYLLNKEKQIKKLVNAS